LIFVLPARKLVPEETVEEKPLLEVGRRLITAKHRLVRPTARSKILLLVTQGLQTGVALQVRIETRLTDFKRSRVRDFSVNTTAR